MTSPASVIKVPETDIHVRGSPKIKAEDITVITGTK
jgi:hypothetical protein